MLQRQVAMHTHVMHSYQDTHTESALYWSAVGLIVCEGLSVGAAADRLGIENSRLRNILRRRRRRTSARSREPLWPLDECH